MHQTAQELVGTRSIKFPCTARCRCCGQKVVVICHKRPMTTRQAAEDEAGAASGGVQGAGEAYYTLFMPASVSAKLWSIISALPSVVAAGVEEWQTLRIKQGEHPTLVLLLNTFERSGSLFVLPNKNIVVNFPVGGPIDRRVFRASLSPVRFVCSPGSTSLYSKPDKRDCKLKAVGLCCRIHWKRTPTILGCAFSFYY